MSWDGELTTIVRYLVDDSVEPYTYSDDRLLTAILVSVQLVQSDVTISTIYSFDVDHGTLSPDPTDPRDDDFITLLCLRTAVLILGSTLRTQSLNSIKVVDGPASIDLSSSIQGVKTLYDNALKAYEDAKIQYALGVNNAGKSVLTPYHIGRDIRGGSYNSYYDCPR